MNNVLGVALISNKKKNEGHSMHVINNYITFIKGLQAIWFNVKVNKKNNVKWYLTLSFFYMCMISR